MVIALLGASGFTGRLVAAALDRRGIPFVAAGRDPDRVKAATAGLTSVTSIVRADVTDEASLGRLLDGVEVVVTTVGPFERLGRRVLAMAVESGSHYVDSTGEQPFVVWALSTWHDAAVERGVTVVPAAGFDFLPGDLLGHLAAGGVEAPADVHVTYAVPGIRGLLGVSSRGTRASVAGLLGRPMLARVDGTLVEEMPGESRRLAWFPRPLGAHHAAGIPAAEAVLLPRHVPGVRTVRTYFALRAWQAELLQAGANAARWAPVRRAAAAVLGRGGDPSARARARSRWACVAEARGEQDEVARAWAYGHDVYGFTAASLVLVAEALAAGGTPPGVRAPSEVVDPSTALDGLAARTDLRWQIRRPAAG